MGPTRFAAAVLTASLLAAPAVRAQDEPPPAKEYYKKVLEKEAGGKLSAGEAAAIKEKILLSCKKGANCKPELLEKTKPKKGKPGAGAAGGGAESQAFEDVEGAPVPGADDGTDAALAPAAGEQAEAARREAVVRRDRAMERASGAADTLRQSLLEAEADPERGAPERGSGPSGGAGAAPSVQELALAERSGYASAFRAHGLKVGAGPQGEVAIQRLDGSPASSAELSRLGAFLRSEPEALRRRPDFFTVISRGQFSELKRDYAARPELRSTAFKHMSLKEGGRDFQWAASCTPLSGDCNPVADDQPYRKGQEVSPEDLEEVWESIAQADGEEEDEEWEEYTEEDRRLAEAEDLAAAKLAGPGRGLPALSSLLARLGGFARGVSEALGLASAGPVPEPVFGASAPDAGADAAGPSRGADHGPVGGTSAATPRRPGAPSAPLGAATPGRRTGLYVLAAAAAAAFIALGLRKRR